MITMAMLPRWRDQGGEVVEELQRGELQRGSPVGAGLGRWQSSRWSGSSQTSRSPATRTSGGPGGVARAGADSLLRLAPGWPR